MLPRVLYLIPILLAGFAQAADYKAYLNEYQPGPGQENGHCGVFVESGEQGLGTGTVYHVVGSVGPGKGMKFAAHQKERDVKGSPEFRSQSEIGVVSSSAGPQIEQIGRSIPPPKSIFIGFQRIQPPPPHYRCLEWAQDFVAALKEQGVLRDASSRPGTPEQLAPGTPKQSPPGTPKHSPPASPKGSPKKLTRSLAEQPYLNDFYSGIIGRGASFDTPTHLGNQGKYYHMRRFASVLAQREARLLKHYASLATREADPLDKNSKFKG